ncbi:hypothetical protein [Solirhodobacter olei]|uniref:hypothetical protein n=1 Tax=Solirhodobacter olei TaxID=2493082 RepID=UPI000FDCC99C|nr:hypothetical protein [Solirhodobacter olei]
MAQAALAAPQSVPSAKARGLMRFIGALEAPGGYDDFYRGVSSPPPAPLSTMTINSVLAWQARVTRTSRSAAAGRYQIIPSTLRKLVREMGLTGKEDFDATLQDSMALRLLTDAGWTPNAAPTDALGSSLARVWASLPLLGGADEGLSAYDGIAGNHALTTPSIFRNVLAHGDKPKVVQAAIRASGKSVRVEDSQPEPHATPEPFARLWQVGAPHAFGARQIAGGRLAASKVVVFTNDPFAVN